MKDSTNMKKFIGVLLGFMLSLFSLSGQQDNISTRVSSNDSLTVNVRFEKMKVTSDELSTQEMSNALLTNSINTTTALSTSINRLTTAVEEGITLSKQTKADIVANQLGVSKQSLQKSFKRNNTIKLVALIPALLFVFYAMGSFLLQKGLDVKNLLVGTAVMALYALIGSGVLYLVGSLIFNKQYFIVKDLMSALF